MFEKDAEEYYKEHLHYEEGRGQHYYDVSVPQAFKDGAEFGYNKAKEDADKMKKELKEQLKSYEGYINDIPLVIDPCKQCKIYKAKGGYDTGHIDSNEDWVEGACKTCCWFYDSKFEVSV